MVERRIQKIGNGSFSVCLPKKWVLNNAGKEKIIEISEFENSLVISTKGGKQKKPCASIMFVELNRCLQRLVALFLNGEDLFEVCGIKSNKTKRDLKNEIRNLFSGIEVVYEEKKMLKLKSFIHPFNISLNSTLLRIIFLVKEQLSELKELSSLASKNLVKSISERETEIDRFYLFGLRQLAMASENALGLKKLGIESQKNCIWYSSILKCLEKISDHVEIIALHFNEISSASKKAIKKEMPEIQKIFEMSSRAVIEKNSGLAEKSLEDSREILGYKKIFLKEAFFRYHTTRILEYCTDLSETVFEITSTN